MNWRKTGIGIAFIVIITALWSVWYMYQYSMDIAKSFEVNDRSFDQRVLIVTQGSEFKDAVVASVIDQLKSEPVYVKVMDISNISKVNESDWTAIVILHTWENWKPQKDAEDFVKRAKSMEKVIILSTSGRGDNMMTNVDGISAASRSSEIEEKANEIVRRLRVLIHKTESSQYNNN